MSIHLNNCRNFCSNTKTCRASTLTLAPSKRCSNPQRQCNQPSIDVLIEIRQACLGHNVVPSISGARPSGRRQRVRSVAEQIESLNCNRHGLLCSCQHQSLHSVGGHYNVRLFKLSRPTRRRNSTNFPLQSDSGIGTCTPLEKEHGSGSWHRRPQTHTDLERECCQVGIIRDEIRVWRLSLDCQVLHE